MAKTEPDMAKTEPEGDHVRTLAPVPAVRAYIKEIIATKSTTSEAGQVLSTATKRAVEQGVNAPMARITARLYQKALNDGLKGRVNWEDLKYYLLDCTDFNRIAPEGMFTPEESGQKRGRKSRADDLHLVEDGPSAA